MIKANDKKNIYNIFSYIFPAFFAALFVLIMDAGLIKALYDLYYGDSSVIDFFKEQGQNVFDPKVRSEIFKLIRYRLLYSIIPVFFCFLFLLKYYSIKLPSKILLKKIFHNNPALSKIIMLSRYLMGGGVAFWVISYHRTFFSSVFHNCLLGNTEDFFRLYLAGFLFLFFTIRWKDFIFDIKHFSSRYPRISLALFDLFISVISCCLVEFQIGSKMKILVYLIHTNVMYWFILQLIFYFIFRNPKPGAIISLLFSYIIGLANDIVYQFRGNYIMFGDLTVIRTALEVAGNYSYKPTKWFWISLVLLIGSIVMVIATKAFKIPKEQKTYERSYKRRIISTLVGEALIVAFIFITFRTGDFYGKVFGVGWDYNENVSAVGYLPYFFSNMDSTRKVVVDGYSSDTVKEIYKKSGSELFNESEGMDSSSDKDSVLQYPNIILIQNEAFSDLSITADVDTDIDTMPFIHSLSENTQKGYLNMSVTGGPTANTEFEILSRSSLQYFPYGSVPYTQYLKQHIPSLVESLKNQKTPYHTVAYHSYYSSGYNRNSVYSFMGFDEKLFENSFLSDFSELELPRGYLSDEANYRRVIKEYEKCASTENPFFCFNVTIQGHGGYSGGPFDWDEPVNVSNFNATDSINTYLSSVKLSDKAFEGLVEYFSKVDEPTIIMMYGDHQPSWDDEAKELLAQHPAWEDESLQTLSQYYVPYIVWANFDIEEYDYLLGWNEKVTSNEKLHLNTLSTNYVGTYLMSQAGVELSVYDKYLLNLHEEVPAITAIGVWDKDGNYYGDAASSPFAERLKDQEMIQYNLIFDDKNKLEDYFLPNN